MQNVNITFITHPFMINFAIFLFSVEFAKEVFSRYIVFFTIILQNIHILSKICDYYFQYVGSLFNTLNFILYK